MYANLFSWTRIHRLRNLCTKVELAGLVTSRDPLQTSYFRSQPGITGKGVLKSAAMTATHSLQTLHARGQAQHRALILVEATDQIFIGKFSCCYIIGSGRFPENSQSYVGISVPDNNKDQSDAVGLTHKNKLGLMRMMVWITPACKYLKTVLHAADGE